MFNGGNSLKKMKLFVLLSIACLLLIIPTAFAVDGEDALESSYDNSSVLTADYYFDANAADDSGNGSITNPYKQLTSARIKDNSNIHLASGEYTLNAHKTINNVTFIGSNASNTIIKFQGKGFVVSSSLVLENVTLDKLIVQNNGNLSATNVIFKGGSSTYGGAIYSTTNTAVFNLENCTFMDCHGKYGGAISIEGATLNINNSLFSGTYSEIYGGAIAAKSKSKININNTRFLNTYSQDDAGGAIYIYDSTFNGFNIEIVNSTANFGGAITSLKSFVYLSNLTASFNKAKYEGGAIYAMYRQFSITDSLLDGNLANNGAAIYAFGIESFIINSNLFINNSAADTAGGVYSLKNDVYYDSILDVGLNNTFINNVALHENDVYESNSPSFVIKSDDYQLIRCDSYYNGTIPSSYDLRSLGYVTSVKNQGNDGNCWAFAALSVLESNILRAGGSSMDLSEENIKDLMAEISVYGWQMQTNEGGKDCMGYSYMVSWLGPVNDSYDKYKIGSVISPILNSSIHVQDILFIDESSSDEIKRAIMSYGAVHSPIYYSNGYKRGDNNYYYDGNLTSNHAVAIVGWDDDRVVSKAPGKGAWIVKNSWGPNWMDKGYFYFSYYDVRLAKSSLWTFILNNTIKYDKNYQYDISGKTDNYYFNESAKNVWYKNRYTAGEDEYLAAVSTYFEKETAWDLYVYVNGQLSLTQSGTATASYKTIDLNELITLRAGDVFEVVFKLSVDRDASVPISESVSFVQKYFTQNMSFISFDGENWLDFINLTVEYSTHKYYGDQVACIKAFTILEKLNPSIELETISPYKSAQFEAIIKDQYGNLVKPGKAIFTVEGEDIQADVVNGIAVLSHVFNEIGDYSVLVNFSANGYNSVLQPFIITIYKDRTNASLILDSAVLDYNNKYVTASLMDLDGSAISQADLVLDINDNYYYSTTDAYGQARFLCEDVISGTHMATAYFEGNVLFYPASANASVFVKTNTSISATYSNGELIAILVNNETGQAIKGAAVRFSVDGQKGSVKSDADGEAIFAVSTLAPGTYTAVVSYNGNGKYNPSASSVDIVVNRITTSISLCYDNATGELVANLINAETGNGITGANVVFTINGVKTTVKTKNGQARLSIGDADPNNFNASISYGGNSKYLKSTASIKIVEGRIPTVISNAYDRQTQEIVATLTNNQTGQAIKGGNVVFTINGVKTTIKTDKFGQAKISVADLDIGQWLISSSYGGNSKYDKSTASITIIKDN